MRALWQESSARQKAAAARRPLSLSAAKLFAPRSKLPKASCSLFPVRAVGARGRAARAAGTEGERPADLVRAAVRVGAAVGGGAAGRGLAGLRSKSVAG